MSLGGIPPRRKRESSAEELHTARTKLLLLRPSWLHHTDSSFRFKGTTFSFIPPGGEMHLSVQCRANWSFAPEHLAKKTS